MKRWPDRVSARVTPLVTSELASAAIEEGLDESDILRRVLGEWATTRAQGRMMTAEEKQALRLTQK